MAEGAGHDADSRQVRRTPGPAHGAERLVGRTDAVQRALAACRPQQGGVVFAGPAGIGKTRLLEEVAGALQSRGFRVERFNAAEALRPLALGPFLRLLAGNTGTDERHVLMEVSERLVAQAGEQPLCVAVDDAHVLDDLSLTCVTDLAQRPGVVVCLTVRTGGPLPSSLVGLWTSGRVERIDIDPLGDEDVAELAQLRLDGPIDGALHRALVAEADGNPLLLRELLIDGRASGAIRWAGETWSLVDMLRPGPRIRDLVAARMHRLDQMERRVLELVAVGEPLALVNLAGAEADALDRLEALDLVRVEAADGALTARVDHPLVGEAVRSQLATRRRVELLRSLVRRVEAGGGPPLGDARRTARWSVAAGDVPSAELALAAAQESLAAFDLDHAVAWARTSLTGREAATALLVLGEALRLRGDVEGAVDALARAAAVADDDDVIVRIAMLRSNLLALQHGQPERALELLDVAARRVRDPVRALELRSEASYLAGLLGRFEDVIQTSRKILARSDLHPDTEWTTTINLLYAQTMLGRLEGAEAAFERAGVLAAGVHHERPEGVDLLWGLRTGVFVQQADLVVGERTITAHLRRCREAGVIHGLTGAICIELLTLRGAPDLFEHIDRTLDELRRSDPYLVLPIAAGSAAVALVLAGRAEEATGVLDLVVDGLEDVRSRPFTARGRAALLAHGGDLDAASTVVADAGRDALAASHVSFGVLALHDAARYGRADLVVDDLTAAVRSSDARLLLAMASRARALAAGEASALDEISRDFAEWGAPRLAAEAAAQAAVLHPPHSSDAVRAAARAVLWARRAPTFGAPVVEIPDALSSRELDVVARALAGGSNRELADELFLSVRTVENHLQRAYAKLAVGGRAELSDVL